MAEVWRRERAAQKHQTPDPNFNGRNGTLLFETWCLVFGVSAIRRDATISQKPAPPARPRQFLLRRLGWLK